MRSSTNHYLTALAVADLVYLLCVFWLSLNHYPILKDDVIASSIFAYAQPFSLWLTDATSTYIYLDCILNLYTLFILLPNLDGGSGGEGE